MAKYNVLAIVLAGGEGKRLMPLTDDRTKPAVPFGGHYRLIDFALSNIVNSGYLKIVVFTQYKSHSLDRRVTKTWYTSSLLGDFITPVSAQQRRRPHWYLGSADAIYQSLNAVDDEKPDYIVIIGADSIYHMDFSQVVDAHVASGLPATVAGIRRPIELVPALGVIDSKDGVIKEFLKKPQNPQGLPDDPAKVLTSMGNYVFATKSLVEALRANGYNPDSKHDTGGDIIPWFVERGECGIYDFKDNDVPDSIDCDRNYRRDVGILDTYYDANMDLILVHPVFNLYNHTQPTTTMIGGALPSTKPVYGKKHSRMGHTVDSFVSPGVIISGGEVYHSIVSPNCYVHSWTQVMDSVVMHECRIGRHLAVSKAILDKNVVLEESVTAGLDLEHDRRRGFAVADSGITIVPKGMVITR